jgi:hypothetical protein
MRLGSRVAREAVVGCCGGTGGGGGRKAWVIACKSVDGSTSIGECGGIWAVASSQKD